MQRLNCAPCRRRKSKCDRAEPCLSCVLRGTEAYCYTDLEQPLPSTRQTTNPNANGVDNEPRAAPQSSSSFRRDSSHSDGLPMTPQGANGSTSSFQPVPPENDVRARAEHQQPMYKTLDAIENALRDVRKRLQTENRNANIATWGIVVPWKDAKTLFPEPKESAVIFHCFFNELRWYFSSASQEAFEAMWTHAEREKADLPRHRVALICAIMAFTLLLTPRAHPVSRLPQKNTTDPRWQIENTRVLLDSYYATSTHSEEMEQDYEWRFIDGKDDLLGQLEAETVFCYYCAVAGLSQKTFFSLGRAIRLAFAQNMFDEARWTQKSAEERERRRCITWDLVVIDRWTAGQVGIQSNLGAVNVMYPLDESVSWTLPRNQITELVYKVMAFSSNPLALSMSERVKRCTIIAGDVQRYDDELNPTFKYDRVRNLLTSCDPQEARCVSVSMSLYFAFLFIQMMLFRPFLLDPTAPLQLRFASLSYARKIIELMRHLVTLLHNPWTSHPPAWSMQNIFVASTIFASVLLSRDSAAANGATPAQLSGWPYDDLEWFSSILLDIVDTFDVVAQGAKTHTAMSCKRLFVSLCSSRDTLRKRFEERERERLKQAKGSSIGIPQRPQSQKRAADIEQAIEHGPSAFKRNVANTYFDSVPDTLETAQSKIAEAPERNKLVPDVAMDSVTRSNMQGTSSQNATSDIHNVSRVPQIGPSEVSNTSPTFAFGVDNRLSTHTGSVGVTDSSAITPLSLDMSWPLEMPSAACSSKIDQMTTPGRDMLSATDLIFLDPLEWEQLTAGLDVSLEM